MTGMDVESLYAEIILDHYRAPHHAGLREPYDIAVHHVNPSCGDEIDLRVRLDSSSGTEVVEDVSYAAVGCSISQAATSVMTDLVFGRPLTDAMATFEVFRELMHGQGRVEPDEDVLEDGIAFAGVAKFPARIKCALLGWSAFRDAASAAVAASAAEAESPVAQPESSAAQPDQQHGITEKETQ
jgi:nitrogen fixation protein NifU and related proteins